WLIRVAQNAAINWAKRSSKEHKLYQRVYSEQHVGMDGPEQTHLKTETEQLVQNALQMLPEKFKRVLILKEYGELDYKEIGKVLGISEGNVKVRVFRAREALAKALEELGYEVS
ncbi:MAG TPA: RNA polymerase sigma factor, partial [Spirochaetales bacterium]|nr:RNA polymerase sigma factor [Spirochaetales bacterium]